MTMRNISSLISRRAEAVDASGIRKVFDLAAKMKDPINLSIGLPDFDVPAVAKQAAIAAIEAGQNRYTQTQGIAPLREKLRANLSAEMGRDVGEVLISSGVSGALLLAIMAVCDPGDEVIFFDPYFVMYKHLVTMAGAVSVTVNNYPHFSIDPDRLASAITPRTKMIMLNSPSNPTGRVMSEAEVKLAVEVAERHGLLILSDEIYERFLYSGSSAQMAANGSPILPSAARHYDRTILLRGFSKSHAMTGWRLGYAAGPTEIIAQMTKLQQYTFVCAPSPLQYAAMQVLDMPMREEALAYERKRDIAYDLLSQNFEVQKPGGAFYIFPQVPTGMTASDFCTRAIENNVLIIPGNVFSRQDTHFRISYATTDAKLEQGCRILCSLAG